MVNLSSLPVFFLFSVLLVAIPMSYLFNLAATTPNVETSALFNTAATLFLFFVVIGYSILSITRHVVKGFAPDLLSKNSNEELGAGLGLAFILSTIIFGVTASGATQSVLQFPIQSIFTNAGEAIQSKFWQVMVIGIAAPLAEEIFFGLGIATGMFMLFNALAKQFRLPFSNVVGVVATVGLTSVLFALFHVSQQANAVFLFYSILFRTFALGLSYADQLGDIVPFLNIGLGVMMGLHLSNNLNTVLNAGGNIIVLLLELVKVMLANDGTTIGLLFGVLVLLFFVSNFSYSIKKVRQIAGV